MEGSKELNNIFKAIDKWMKKHKNNVHFIGSFMAFKGKDFEVIDDRMLAYGIKDMLKEDLKGLDEEVEKEKGEFVSW